MARASPSTPTPDAWNEFGLRFRSKDRKHGEPFPLPRLSKSAAGGSGSSQALKRRVDGAVKVLNDLASASFDTAPCSLPLTQSQTWIMDDVWRRIAQFGERPPDLDEDEALRELASRANLYTGEAAHLADFDMDKIKILRRRRPVLPAYDLLPPHGQVYLDYFAELIEKTSTELASDLEHEDPIEPYWDPRLKRDKDLRFRFYQSLDAAGLLTFRRRRKARVGFFVVHKKDGMQRLIVDARQANQCHRRPPTTRLATAAGMAELDFIGEEMSGCGPVSGACLGPSMAAGDVGDCFYNFSVDCLSSWFCTDDVGTVRDLRGMGFNVDKIYDDVMQEYVELGRMSVSSLPFAACVWAGAGLFGWPMRSWLTSPPWAANWDQSTSSVTKARRRRWGRQGQQWGSMWTM